MNAEQQYRLTILTNGQKKLQRSLPMQQRKPKAGSMAAVAKWSQDKKSLSMGSDRFDIEGIAASLSLDEEASKQVCWPVLLTSKPADDRMAVCPCPGKPGHENRNSSAHKAPAGFDLKTIRKNHCTIVQSQQTQANKARSKRPMGGAQKKQKRK